MLHVRCYGYASRIAEMLAMEGIKLSGGQEVGIKHLLANEILANEWPVAGAFAVERLHSPNVQDEPHAQRERTHAGTVRRNLSDV